MTASVRRRTPFRRVLLALGGVAVLGLLALVALLLGGALDDHGQSSGRDPQATKVSVVGEPGHGPSPGHAIRQQASTRFRSAVYAVLAIAIAVAAWAFCRVRLTRTGRLRALRVFGLPSGRAPPALRIV
jgi:hypothetical protein